MYAAFALNYRVLIYEKVLSRIVFAVFVNWHWEISANTSLFITYVEIIILFL